MKEIERKFKIEGRISNKDAWGGNIYSPQVGHVDYGRFAKHGNGKYIDQGYLPLEKGLELYEILTSNKLEFTPEEARLRRVDYEKYLLNFKAGEGMIRDETPDLELSERTFDRYWRFTDGQRIRKYRNKINNSNGRLFLEKIAENPNYQGFKELVIDVYQDRELIILEAEFNSLEQALEFPIIGIEVTHDKNYKNRRLAK
jgi:hypothetical protein